MSGRIALLPHWNAGAAARLARVTGATALVGATPTMIEELLALPTPEGSPLPIESFSIHGAALRRGLMEEILRRAPGARFSTGYGLTETSGSIAGTSGAELIARPGTCGPILPTVELEIVDPRGHPQPPGTPGELRVKGAMLFSGYLRDDSPYTLRGPSDWFLTGDIGVLDDHGFLSLLERGSDAIGAGLGSVYCADVENFLDAGGYGSEVVAVGTGGGRQLLVGIVCDKRDLDTDGLKRDIQQAFGLSAEAITVICRTELPRTSSGKIDRRALARMAME